MTKALNVKQSDDIVAIQFLLSICYADQSHLSWFDPSPLILDMVQLLCVWLWYFSENGTALCVRILNATAKFDLLLENLVRFGSSSPAISLLDSSEMS